MISIQKQFLFIHVPKTGGNSIQNILKAYSEDEIVTPAEHQDGVERFEVRNSRYNITKHSTLAHYRSILDAETYQSLFKFATIRNPWDMMISFYFSPHRGAAAWDRNAFRKLIEDTPAVRTYIREKMSLAKRVLASFSGNPKLDGDVNYLIRFERLDEDFQAVCEKLNIPHSPLPNRNRSTRQHYSKYYDRELKEAVRKKFAEEIEWGGYRFEQA